MFCNNFDRTLFRGKHVSEAASMPFMAYSIGSELVPERKVISLERDDIVCIPVIGIDNCLKVWKVPEAHCGQIHVRVL